MMLLAKSNLLEKASEKFDENNSLKCWVKQERGHQLYVFSVYFPNQETLSVQWVDAKQYIAAYVQGLLLDKAVERWNLYLFFLVGETVDSQLQYVIEQDKYSTRKIVLDEVGDHLNDKNISNMISETLFLLEIKADSINDTDNIDDILKSKHSEVFDFIATHRDENTKDVFDEMTKKLGQE